MYLLLQYVLLIIILSAIFAYLILYYKKLREYNKTILKDSSVPDSDGEKEPEDEIEGIYQSLIKKYSLSHISNKKTYNKNKNLLDKINQAYTKKDITQLKSFL